MRHNFVALSLVFLLCLGMGACGEQVTKTEAIQETQATNAADKSEQSDSSEGDLVSETDRLNEWFEEKYEEELMMSPIQLTFLGRKERLGELDDMSEAGTLARIEWKKQTVEEMKALFNYSELSDTAKLSYDLWIYQYENMAAEKKFLRHGYIFEQMNGCLLYTSPSPRD